MIRNDETLDDLLHGELKLVQKKRGFRYSVDALLLASFALPLCRGKDVLDMGCGSGVVALIMAKRGKPRRVVGIELQDTLAELARRNAELNKTEPRVEIIKADALDASIFPRAGAFDLVVTNPPFRAAGSGRAGPNPERAGARHELFMNIRDWLGRARALVKPGGSVCVVYPVSEQGRLLEAAGKAGLFAARRQYATDRPGGRRRLVLYQFVWQECALEDLEDVPIETGRGKFSLDGYR